MEPVETERQGVRESTAPTLVRISAWLDRVLPHY